MFFGLDDSFYSLYKAMRETGNGRPLNSHEEFRHSKGAKGHRHHSVCSRTQQRVPKFALPEYGTLEKKHFKSTLSQQFEMSVVLFDTPLTIAAHTFLSSY